MEKRTLRLATAALLCLLMVLMGRMFAVTAHAAGTATLDEATGVLTISGEVVKGMFQGCDNLTTIYVSDLWNLTSSYDSSFMFTDCVKLVGGNGTKYNSSNTEGYSGRYGLLRKHSGLQVYL